MKSRNAIVLSSLTLIIFIFCGFITDISTVRNYFRGINASTISGGEIEVKFPTTRNIKTLEQKDINKLAKLLSTTDSIRVGKLPVKEGIIESLTLYMEDSKRITFVITSQGCWFYYPIRCFTKQL